MVETNRTKKADKDEAGTNVSIYLPLDVLAALDRMAKGEMRKRSAMIQVVLREKLGMIPEQ